MPLAKKRDTPLRPREQQALEVIQQTQPTRRRDLAKAMGISPNTAGQYVWILQRRSLIWSTGPGRRSTWSVVPC